MTLSARLLAAALLVGAVTVSAPLTATSAQAADAAELAAADALWAQRVDQAKLREALAAYEKIAASDPTNRYVLGQLTRGWYFLGDGHLTDKQEKIDTWAVAMTWGDKCLALNADYGTRLAGGEKPKDAGTSLGKDEVPCMYWYATALGKWGKIQGIAKALANLPTVKAFIGRVEELDPTYFFYGPARYWGAYYAVLPSFAGQDLGKSAQYFQASIDGAPGYLATRGLRAENLATKSQDVATFRSDIAYILAFDATSIPEVQPENTLEQAKAKALLAQEGELFDKKVIEAYEASH